MLAEQCWQAQCVLLCNMFSAMCWLYHAALTVLANTQCWQAHHVLCDAMALPCCLNNGGIPLLATKPAGYSAEVQPEHVVDALAWGDGLMETCWNDNHMQSARHTMVH